MQRIDTISRKIKSAKDLQSIVKTMKVLAAVSIRQYQYAVDSITGYFETIEQGLRIILKNQPSTIDILQPSVTRDSIRKIAVVFGSSQPMCGTFNEVLATYVKTKWETDHKKKPEKVVAIGNRIVPGLERIGWRIDHQFDVPSTIDGVNETVQALVVSIQQWHSLEAFQYVYLLYNRPHSKSQYLPISQQLLPLDISWLKTLTTKPWESNTLPKYTMRIENLFSALVRQLLFVTVYKAFSESLSAENDSRLAAMQVAEKKIDEKLDELTKTYRNQRQINITEEILDIVASYEVLRGEEKGGTRD